jgi:hypothetical protein
MKHIYYEKRGRRYYPVNEYDSELFHSMTKGTHLVQCYPGGQSIRYNIDPAYAPLIAAGRVAEYAISNAVRNASEMRPKSKPFTEEQRAAWDHLIAVFGDDARMLEWPSARECAEEAVRALIKEADQLMQYESVKAAYDQFLLVCELTKEHNAQTR